MKKYFSAILALSLLLGATPLIHAELPENEGAPSFSVETRIAPDMDVSTQIEANSLTVTAGQPLLLTATTTYTSNKGEHQTLRFVSDAWEGVDGAEQAGALEIEAEPAGRVNERRKMFISTAELIVSEQPGMFDVVVSYTITLEHDASGKRSYTASASFAATVTVLPQDPAVQEEEMMEGEPLNHGQIVSAWAQWKQTKGSRSFSKGGPGVHRSITWYKTQVEHGTFHTRQEVIDKLESLYEPVTQQKPGREDHPGKGKGKPGK